MKALPGASALLVAIAAPAAADPLQDQLLAGMKASNTADIAFTQTIRVEHTGGKPQEIVTRYDPRAASGARWTLVQIDGQPPTQKQRADAAKRTPDKSPHYGSLADWFGNPAQRIAQTPGSVTYRFARLPAGTVKIAGHDASADTVADAVVNTAGRVPYVERVRFTSDKSFRMKLVAKVERYVVGMAFTPLADGRAFPAAVDVEMTGSLLGKSGYLKTRTRYTDAHSVR